MKLIIDCPYGKYDADMRITCQAQEGGMCAFQYYKPCKGWCVLLPGAKGCLLRKTGGDKRGNKASKTR